MLSRGHKQLMIRKVITVPRPHYPSPFSPGSKIQCLLARLWAQFGTPQEEKDVGLLGVCPIADGSYSDVSAPREVVKGASRGGNTRVVLTG